MKAQQYLEKLKKLASSPTAYNRSEARVIAKLAHDAYNEGVSLTEINLAIREGKKSGGTDGSIRVE